MSSAAARSHNVAKEVVLVSERKGHILPVDLEPTTIPPGLKYALAGIQHVEYFQGDPDQNLKTILRSLERAGVTHRAAPQAGRGVAGGRPGGAVCRRAAGPGCRGAGRGRGARGAAVRQHQLRPGDRLLQRRADRRTDRAALAGERDRARLALGVDAVQGPRAGHPRYRQRARRALHRRRQRAAVPGVGTHHRAAGGRRDEPAGLGQHLQGQARRHLRHPGTGRATRSSRR